MLGLAQFRRNLALHDDAQVRFQPETGPGPADRIFVFVPHCDDETLGVGGFIHAARRAGAAVEILFSTNGDGSRSTQLAENARRLRHNSFLDLAAMRQKEALAACRQLGVSEPDVHFLGFPDRGTGRMWLDHWHRPYLSPFTRVAQAPYPNATTPKAPYSGLQMFSDVRSQLARFQPTHLFTTHPNDTHPDHWACWAFAFGALESLRQDAAHGWAVHCALRAFMVHRGVWPAPHGYQPKARLAPPADLMPGAPGRWWTDWQLDAPARAAKKKALAQHDSQMAFTPLYLRGFLRRNELFEAVEPANATFSAAGPAPRGVSVVAATGETVTLRVHLRQAAAPRGSCSLCLRAVSPGGVRAWNVELHGRESHAQASGESFLARAKESMGASGAEHPQNWPGRRGESSHGGGSPQKRRRGGTGTSFDLEIPRAALEFSGGRKGGKLCLMVSATSRLGKTVLEHTEIGAVRLHELENVPVLVARSDPRYAAREAAREARRR